MSGRAGATSVRGTGVLGTLLVGVLAGACHSGASTGTRLTTTVDTIAGVPRVHYAGMAPTLRLQPLVTLGLVGSAADSANPQEFGKVVSVIADEGGRIYVADGIALEIRVFGPDGAFLRRIGREGRGPGELEGLHGIAWVAGDTMVAVDYGNARLTRITTEGVYVGQWPWLRLTGDARFVFNGGPREVWVHGVRREVGAGGVMHSVWVRYTTDGPSDSLDVPTAERRPGASIMCRREGMIGFLANPFGDQLLAVPAPGELRVVAWSPAYRLAFLDPAGDTTRVLSRDIEPVPLPDSAWAPFEKDHDDFEKRWNGASCEGDISRPDHRPILRGIYFGQKGRMLVEHTTSAGWAFDLFDTDGTWIATFPSLATRDTSVPPFLRGDRLYLVTKDSLDVQRVRSYAVRP